MKTGFALSEIDTTKPHPARMYDAYLGGKDNYPADREAVRQVLRAFPEVRAIARANRAFMQRAPRPAVRARRAGEGRHRRPAGPGAGRRGHSRPAAGVPECGARPHLRAA